MAKRCVIRGVVDGYSSYSLHCFRVVEGMTNLGRDVALFPITVERGKGPIPKVVYESLVNKHQQEDWEMIIHCPSFKPTGNKRLVYNTMWETTRLHKEGVINLNQADLIVAPSNWNIGHWNAQGVKKPMTKVPLGIDTSVFHYRPPMQKEVFVFGTAGRTSAGGCRKGFKDVLEAWKKAFPKRIKDVRLLVKMHPDDPDIDIDDDRVLVKKEFWTRAQLASWYEGLDCLVSASYGEGWGLHQQEAAATGRSVICVPFGGISEWFNDEIGYPVDYVMTPAGDHYDNGGLWAKPKQESLVDRMREVFQTRRCEKALRASERAMSFSWDNSNKMLNQALVNAGIFK